VIYAMFAHEGDEFVNFAPSVDVAAGEPIEISTGYWGVSPIPVRAGMLGDFRVRGVFRGHKENPADDFNVGELITFDPGSGFQDGSGTWRVREFSASGDPKVYVEINAQGAGGGGGALPSNLLKYEGDYSPETGLPALTDATGDEAEYYTVTPPTAEEIINFGSGNITFPAGTGGTLIHNGTIWEFFPASGGGTPGGPDRENGTDDLGSFAGAFAIDHDADDYDNKKFTMTGDINPTPTSTREKRYGWTIVQDATGGHSVNWGAWAIFIGAPQQPSAVASQASRFELVWTGTGNDHFVYRVA
jgi:hypothetical protein